MRESGRIKSFLFLFILIEFWDLYYSNIFLRVEIDEEPPWPLPSSQKLLRL